MRGAIGLLRATVTAPRIRSRSCSSTAVLPCFQRGCGDLAGSPVMLHFQWVGGISGGDRMAKKVVKRGRSLAAVSARRKKRTAPHVRLDRQPWYQAAVRSISIRRQANTDAARSEPELVTSPDCNSAAGLSGASRMARVSPRQRLAHTDACKPGTRLQAPDLDRAVPPIPAQG